MKTIYLASNNHHKAEEIQAILTNYNIVTLKEVGIQLNTIEDGNTFEENAYKKAKELFDIVKQPCIADDSGLEVEALNGAPGIYSARYAGENATDEENYKKLLIALKTKNNKKANFNCTICYIDSNSIEYFEGIFNGSIGKIEGKKGFGYDPVFYPIGSNHSVATYSSTKKNKLSHRFLALMGLKRFLALKFET